MKLLICGLNYAPDMIGIAKYTTEMAEWLRARGHEVAVVTAPSYYPAWKRDPNEPRGYRRETVGGVNIVRCPIYVPANPSGFRRLLHLLSFAASSLPAVIREAFRLRPDVVIDIAPAAFSAPGARLAAALVGARSWLHIQDFELDAAFSLGLLKGPSLHRAALAVESRCLRMFDRVSTISPQMRRRLIDKGCEEGRVREFRNWVDLSAIRPLAGPNAFRAALGIRADQRLVLYSGNIARKQGLEILVRAARLMAAREDIMFLICGNGPGRADIEASAQGLANMRFLDLQPMARLGELLSAADIHVLPQLADAADLVLPSKLGGMLASGRPVIAMAGGGTGLAAAIEGCGIAIPPEDLSALVAAIERLCGDPSLRSEMGTAARGRADEVWSAEGVLGRFERDLADLAGAAPDSPI